MKYTEIKYIKDNRNFNRIIYEELNCINYEKLLFNIIEEILSSNNAAIVKIVRHADLYESEK